MIKIAEYLSPQPTLLWKLVKQAGVDYAVGALPYGETTHEQPWEFGPLQRLKQRYEDAGFTLAVIESWPPMDQIRLGGPERDREIGYFCELLHNMGRLGIPTLCYNFMAKIGWTRTDADIPTRGRARQRLRSQRDARPAADRGWDRQ